MEKEKMWEKNTINGDGDESSANLKDTYSLL